MHSALLAEESLGSAQGRSCAEPFPPKESSGNQALWAGAHPAKCAPASQPKSSTGSARGVRGVLMFQEATGRHAQQGLLNDKMLPFSASPLVGLWYVELHLCGSSGNLNTALGSLTNTWLGEAGMAWPWPTVQAVTLTAFLWTRMGLECRIKEDLVMQNDLTLSIIKHLKDFVSHKRTPSNKKPS